MTARQPPSHPTGLVAARRLPGKPPEEAATETDVTARRACFRRSRRGLTEQEVVLHVPLKRVIIPIKQGVAQGEWRGERRQERERRMRRSFTIFDRRRTQ